MIKIAICDDEVTTLHQTHTAVKQYCEGAKMAYAIDLFSSGEALLESQHHYTIMLLDIDMGGISGIETAQLIRQRDKKVKIIYLTNYSDYTTFAFSVHAFAYLLKPLDVAQLHSQLNEAFEYMTEPVGFTMGFQTLEGLVRINSQEIMYFEYLNRKVLMHVAGGPQAQGSHTQGSQPHTTYTLKRRMSDLEEELKDKGFAMPHKSFIVNLQGVKGIKHYDIHLVDSTVIPLSQKKSVAFRTALNLYLSQVGGYL